MNQEKIIVTNVRDLVRFLVKKSNISFPLEITVRKDTKSFIKIKEMPNYFKESSICFIESNIYRSK